MDKKPDADRAGRLLVRCARAGLKAHDRAEIRRLLDPPPDWESLIRKADVEGVLPLLYWSLRNEPDSVPPDVLERLKVHYLRVLARNAQTARQAGPFLRAVREAGLEVVLTKGLRLASAIYPDIGLRPFWDMDLVARPADWPAVKKILDGLGFEEAAAVRPGPDQAGLEPGWIYSPYFRRGDLVLEFHFNVLGLHFPVAAGRPEGMTVRPMVLQGTEAMIFSPEYELCYLCLHAQQHSYQKLIWLTDIAEMASREDVGWAAVFRISDAMKIHAPVYYALFLVNALWPDTVPQDVLSTLRPPRLARTALDFFWPRAGVAGRKSTLTWPYYMPSLFSLWERRSLRLAARAVSAILFPPRPWLARACGLPEDSPRLYYQYARRITRPVGLAVRRLMSTR
jgi:hypothetical protein